MRTMAYHIMRPYPVFYCTFAYVFCTIAEVRWASDHYEQPRLETAAPGAAAAEVSCGRGLRAPHLRPRARQPRHARQTQEHPRGRGPRLLRDGGVLLNGYRAQHSYHRYTEDVTL